MIYFPKRYYLVFLIFFLSSLLYSPLGHTASKLQPDLTLANAVVVLVNQYRLSKGLPVLKVNAHITLEAQNHSLNMAKGAVPFGHTGFGDRMKRLFALLKGSSAGGENVAYNYGSVEQIIGLWLNSAGHRQNIEGNYNYTGVGVVRTSSGQTFYTQIFIRAQ